MDERQRGLPHWRATLVVPAEVADVGAAMPVDHHVVRVERRDAGEIGMDGDAAAVDAEQLPVGHRDDEHSPIGQPAEARRLRRHVEDPLDAAVEPDGEYPVVVHVGDEEPAVVPARTFEEDEAVGDDRGDERHRGQSDMSLKSVASCFWNGALKVAPKHGPPPLRWSWTATGPASRIRMGSPADLSRRCGLCPEEIGRRGSAAFIARASSC